MVVVWLAIMIVLFLGVAAFAIDVAYWHLVQGREQRAADAAALAGAVSYPGNQTGGRRGRDRRRGEQRLRDRQRRARRRPARSARSERND